MEMHNRKIAETAAWGYLRAICHSTQRKRKNNKNNIRKINIGIIRGLR